VFGKALFALVFGYPTTRAWNAPFPRYTLVLLVVGQSFVAPDGPDATSRTDERGRTWQSNRLFSRSPVGRSATGGLSAGRAWGALVGTALLAVVRPDA
jgi:hypothetical protein